MIDGKRLAPLALALAGWILVAPARASAGPTRRERVRQLEERERRLRARLGAAKVSRRRLANRLATLEGSTAAARDERSADLELRRRAVTRVEVRRDGARGEFEALRRQTHEREMVVTCVAATVREARERGEVVTLADLRRRWAPCLEDPAAAFVAAEVIETAPPKRAGPGDLPTYRPQYSGPFGQGFPGEEM